MKKLIIILLLIILPVVIYVNSINHKIYYVALGDSLAVGQNPYGKIGYSYSDYVSHYLKQHKELDFFSKDYATSGYRTTDLINDINSNKKINVDGNNLAIKSAISKADVVTLSIGANDFFYRIGITSVGPVLYDENQFNAYVDEVIFDIENLIILMRRYCKEDVILVGYYNPLWPTQPQYSKEVEPTFIYANNKMKALAKKYKMYFVDVYQMFKDNPDYLDNPLDIHPDSSGYDAIADKIIAILNKYVLS